MFVVVLLFSDSFVLMTLCVFIARRKDAKPGFPWPPAGPYRSEGAKLIYVYMYVCIYIYIYV